MTGCLLWRPKASNICVVLHWCPLVFFALPQVPSFSASKERSKNYFYTFEAEENPLKSRESSMKAFFSLLFYLKVPDSLGSMTQARMYGMLLSRFVVGIGTAINAASRSYVSKATFQDERTTHIV